MHLKLDRIGPILSDRIVLDEAAEDVRELHADHSFLGWVLRIISWIYAPSCYTSENQRTIACLKKYLIDQIGQERLQRVCGRYGMSLDEMESEGSPLLARDIAKIVISIKDVKVDDIDELIELAQKGIEQWPASIDKGLRDSLKKVPNSESLSSEDFARLYQALGAIGRTEDVDELIALAKEDEAKWPEGIELGLRTSLRKARNYYELKPAVLTRVYEALNTSEPFAIVPPIVKEMPGAMPTEFLACSFFDSLLADRERLALSRENPTHSFETFVHNFVVKIIGRDMEVGMLIPASDLAKIEDPADELDPSLKKAKLKLPLKPQFYRVAAKIITGVGMVSYVLMPATKDSFLKPIRFFRGTSLRPSAIDSSSTMITDMETDLGRSSYESGKIYEGELKKIFAPKSHPADDNRPRSAIPLAAGHSLGSTQLQYLIVDDRDGDIEKAYFFNGPGLPAGEVEKFNEQILDRQHPDKLQLVIRDSNTDIFCNVGTKHLGWEAPIEKVDVDYFKWFPRYETTLGNAHVQVPDRENRIAGIEGLHQGLPTLDDPVNDQDAFLDEPGQLSELERKRKVKEADFARAETIRVKLDAQLDREAYPGRVILCLSNEALRQLIGPCIAAIIELVRDIFRCLFSSRVYKQLGLHYGTYEKGKWQTAHLRPEELSPLNMDPLEPAADLVLPLA